MIDFGMSYWVSVTIGVFPLLVAYLIAMGIALVQMRAYPRVAMLVSITFGCFLLITIVQTGVQPLITTQIVRNHRMGAEARQIGTAIIASLFNVARGILTLLLCYAAFTGRVASPRPSAGG